ncbi:hypothetical protein [Nocardia terpenica]|uniref:Secreted protein n=1 Tax=Nocardia terpenica TaxID=455432 RepID=A0A6G9YYR6_9NOCA|nr:hypothetical protein [Nocardia terpenica]QIS18267.1 hypothetical protein F6W96_08225 [Nocardia terpenica]
MKKIVMAVLAPLAAAPFLAVVAGQASAAGPLDFDCILQRVGWASCNPTQGSMHVGAGQSLSVNLISSGGTQVKFCAETAGQSDDLGCTDGVNPGANTTLVWRNTGGDRDVTILAKPTYSLATVEAKGNYTIG